MNKTLLSLIATGAFFVAGCEEGSEDNSDETTNQVTNTSSSSGSRGTNTTSSSREDSSSSSVQTGIIPEIGKYNFSARGYFSVASSNSISFSQDGYAYYGIPIKNGSFSYRNGALLSGARSDNSNLYPTDGFKISGSFSTPTSASGSIEYSRVGQVYESTSFSATK